MFKYQSPIFLHKALLKKEMLDELRDYPQALSRMMLAGCGDGIIRGTDITWDNQVLYVHPGLVLHRGNIYRMEAACSLDCPPTDKLTYIKVRFMTEDQEKYRQGGLGELAVDGFPAENGEMELGRFRLQEGARLRTAYENFEDYRTEFDTVNRIHAPFLCPGGTGLWPELLLAFAKELLETGTEQAFDVPFAMQLLGTRGQAARELVLWYIEKKTGKKQGDVSNGALYEKLCQILAEQRKGPGSGEKAKSSAGQMILL